jgi:twinkle protein
MKEGFSIVDNSIRDGMMVYRESGALRGCYLGFPLLDEKYSMALPGVTDITGFPGSGKSEFLLELLLNTSLFYGWKHLLYVPDVGDKNEIVAILIHKVSGKTFDKRFVNSNYISEQEVDRNLDWVLHHFRIMVKDNLKVKITPYEFWDIAAQMNKDVDGGIQTATIDSWKDMKHGVGMEGEGFARDDKYLDDVLSYRNSMSELHKMHFFTIIHPVKTEADKDGQRKPPTPYDLKGGGTWYDSGKCMITVHRQSGHPNAVDVMITKAKPKSVASVGKVELYFDRNLAKFYWMYQGEKVYAKKEKFKPIGTQVYEEVSESLDEEDSDIPF